MFSVRVRQQLAQALWATRCLVGRSQRRQVSSAPIRPFGWTLDWNVMSFSHVTKCGSLWEIFQPLKNIYKIISQPISHTKTGRGWVWPLGCSLQTLGLKRMLPVAMGQSLSVTALIINAGSEQVLRMCAWDGPGNEGQEGNSQAWHTCHRAVHMEAQETHEACLGPN